MPTVVKLILSLIGFRPFFLAPCTPQNVSAVRECGADAIMVTWKSNSNAIFYVAMAQDGYGVIHSCNSMGLTCKIEGLKCSTNYTAYVIASNFICNSSESEMVTIETGAEWDIILNGTEKPLVCACELAGHAYISTINAGYNSKSCSSSCVTRRAMTYFY